MRGETPAVEHVRTRCCFSFSSCLTLCGPTRAAPRVDSFGDQTGLPSAKDTTPTARQTLAVERMKAATNHRSSITTVRLKRSTGRRRRHVRGSFFVASTAREYTFTVLAASPPSWGRPSLRRGRSEETQTPRCGDCPMICLFRAASPHLLSLAVNIGFLMKSRLSSPTERGPHSRLERKRKECANGRAADGGELDCERTSTEGGAAALGISRLCGLQSRK